MGNANREEFLDFLAQKAKRPRHQLHEHPFQPLNDLPETTLSGKSQDELLEIAQKNSEAVKVDFKKVTTENLGKLLDEYIVAKKIKNLILPTTDKWNEFNLDKWQKEQAATYWQPQAAREVNIKTAQSADGAVGFADYLLAESGTITVATTAGQGRAFNFLPTHYLSIIKKSDIVPRTRQAMDKYDADIKNGVLSTSNINFITGPSNSGDIEMVLVVGVHGPLDMTYVVVEDL